MSRCTGHCCRGFFLPYTYRGLFEKAEGLQDGEQIRDMVIPLYWEKTVTGNWDDDDWDLIRYGCKHQLPNGDCGIYENRPTMCRDYPHPKGRDGGSCLWPGCTYTS